MSVYSVTLFAHIVGVIVLSMATAIAAIGLHRLRGAATTDQLSEWAGLTKTTAALFHGGGGLTMASGLYMSLTVWDLTIPWIGLSMVGVAAIGVLGHAVIRPRLEDIETAAASEPSGRMSASLARQVQDPVLLASVHALAALNLGVVFLKVVRPDLVESLAVLGLALVAAVLSALVASRGSSLPAEADPYGPAIASEVESISTSDRRAA